LQCNNNSKPKKELRVIITQIDELISNCDQEITMREYSSYHQKIIREGWEELRCWMAGRANDEFTEELANMYCVEIFGSLQNYDHLSNKQKQKYRSVRMLASYQRDGDFEFRIITKPRAFKGATGEVMEKYLSYLHDVLVLKETTISNKRHYLFLFNEYLESNSCTLKQINAKTIPDFYFEQNLSLPVLHNCNSTLKLFLKYIFDTGVTPRNCSIYIAPDNYRKECKIPTTYTKEEISRILAAVNRSSAIGKRDYLILLLAAEYGWRASDITKFEFSQIDWDNNRISLEQHKTDVTNAYPLLSSIGNAIIDYLKNGRPLSESKEIIVSAESSKRGKPLHSGTIHSVVARYMNAANIKDWRQKKHGPHSLRHSLASNMLKNNISMPVIGTVLGHQSTESTKAYLSIDIEKLKECPLPMPNIKTAFYRGWHS
jgi:site-specific recombinase XerD